MAGPLTGPRLRAVGLVLPLVAFIGLTFVAPLATMLSRSVYDPVVADALPETVGLLQDWDGAQVPPEPVFEAMARELGRAREERILGRVAARVNRVRGGLRTVLTPHGAAPARRGQPVVARRAGRRPCRVGRRANLARHSPGRPALHRPPLPCTPWTWNARSTAASRRGRTSFASICPCCGARWSSA